MNMDTPLEVRGSRTNRAKANRIYSSYSQYAMQLLGRLIKQARLDKRFTTKDLADRAAISRSTLLKIENGDMTVEAGLVFEVAFILGIKLFEADESSLVRNISRINNQIALVPKYVREHVKVANDDF